MNRYKSGGPSKATATTMCQKCLKRGHYSYECTAAQQERPYVSRPSRTQQLLNPKLAPKLTEAKLEPKEPELIKSASRHEGRDSDAAGVSARQRSGSVSSYSSDSVSTISTNRSSSRSPSQSPPPQQRRSSGGYAQHDQHRSTNDYPPRQRKSPPPRHRLPQEDRHYRRRSASWDAESSREENQSLRRSRSPEPERDRSPRSRLRSRSPYRARYGDTSSGRMQQSDRNGGREFEARASPRPRSLSPYSKRVAMARI